MAEFNLQAIAARRIQLGISSAEMAKKLGMPNRSVYWKYENGKYKFRAEDLPKLANALKCSVSRFYARESSETEQSTA
jgi:transcriptional regulator with XRE-family HTH domain